MKKVVYTVLIVAGALCISFGSYYAGAKRVIEEVSSVYTEGFYGMEIGETGSIYDNDSEWTVTRVK